MGRWQKKDYFVVVLLVSLAAMTRFYNIAGMSYWSDELSSLMTSRNYLAPFQKTFHPPFHYLSLAVWQDLFGDSEAATRSLSVLFSLVNVCLVYVLGRNMFQNRIAGIVAAVLYATLPRQLTMDRQIRMYAPWVMWMLISFWGLWELMNGNRRTVAKTAYIGGLVGGALTHHYTVLYAIPMSICLLVAAYRADDKTVRRQFWMLHLPFAAVGLLIAAQFTYKYGTDLPNLLVNFVTWRDRASFSLIRPFQSLGEMSHLLFVGESLASLLATGSFTALFAFLGSRQLPRWRSAIFLLAMSTIVIISIPPMRNTVYRLFMPSYALFYILAGGAAVALSQYRKLFQSWLGTSKAMLIGGYFVFVAAFLPSGLQHVLLDTGPYPWREVTEFVHTIESEDSIILVEPFSQRKAFNHYYPKDKAVEGPKQHSIPNPSWDHKSIILVIKHGFPSDDVYGHLQANRPLLLARQFRELNIYKFDVSNSSSLDKIGSSQLQRYDGHTRKR